MNQHPAIAIAEAQLGPAFGEIAEIRRHNQKKVLDAFRTCGVAGRHFHPSLGYGYGDDGRDMLDRVFAAALGTEDAFVRAQFASGTHVISCCLQALCTPGSHLISASGAPYDTLFPTVAVLQQGGVAYAQLELGENGIDVPAVLAALQAAEEAVVVYVQRSRGYAWRPSLGAAEITALARQIHAANPDAVVLLDNCYGEFVEKEEPQVDLFAGSLIKNLGGGLAPTGGYCAGRAALVNRVADRLLAPGIGREVGSHEGGYRNFYQGLFQAPQVVAAARMGALLVAKVFESLGFEALPKPGDAGDLVASVQLNAPHALEAFCRAVQAASPVDAMARPEAWDMPGYEDAVIMAAGTFVQGASIELSADGPMRPPYTVYVQGGLSYDHVVLALEEILHALQL